MTISSVVRLAFERQAAWVLLLMMLVVILVLGIGFHRQVRDQLYAWKLLPEPEKLTELYFARPNSLPATYRPGQTQTVGFTVHNLEYKPKTYHYRITEASQNSPAVRILTAGNFTISQNQYRTVTVPIALADLGSRIKITAALTNVNESIGYLLNRSGA